MHLDDLGDLYVWLLEGEAPGGTLLLAVSDGTHWARVITDAASRAGGAGGRVEAWPLDEALEKLGDHAYALALDQRLPSERARRLDALGSFGLRGARERVLLVGLRVLRITVEDGYDP